MATTYSPLGFWVLVRDKTPPPPDGGHIEQPTDVLRGVVIAAGIRAEVVSLRLDEDADPCASGAVVAFQRSSAIEIDKDRSGNPPWPSLYIVHFDNLLTLVRTTS